MPLECTKSKENKTYTVYMHLFPNGKVYIGASRQQPISKRWRAGSGYKNQKYLFSAIERFGWNNIEHIIIQEDLQEEEAKSLEKRLIKQYDSQNPEHGYNTKDGGQVFGEHSEEFLNKLHSRMVGNKYCVGRKLSKEHIDALVNSRKGHFYPSKRKGVHDMPEEMKKHLSIKAKERWSNPETRKKYIQSRPDMSGKNNPRYGSKLSDETKNKIRAKAIGRKLSKETRIKFSQNACRGVIKYDSNMAEIERFCSCKDAALSVGGNSTNVSFACKNPNRTYKGYYWRYSGIDGKSIKKKVKAKC